MDIKSASIIPDAYERRARLAPALLAIAPLSATVVALGIAQHPAVTAIVAFLSVAVAPIVMMSAVASAGRRVETRLYREWGGKPTALLLRATGSADASPSQTKLWRRAMERTTGVKLLGRGQETADLNRADDQIEAAVGLVRKLSYDGKHPQISQENRQYGFERNVYGIRWWGRGIALAALLVLGGALLLQWGSPDWIWIGLVTNTVLLIIWCLLPSSGRTRAAAMRYGKQLFNAVASENPDPRTS